MKRKKFIAVICILLLLVITGCSSEKDESNNTSTGSNGSTYTPSELEKNIISSGEVTKAGTLVVFATNNNKVAVDMEIEVEFYDADGIIVGSDSDYLDAVGKGAETALEMYDTPEKFDNYKIYVDVEETKYTDYFDQIELTHNNTGEDIVVQVKNNSNNAIENVSVSVVYYKEDKVVGIDDGFDYDIESGRSAVFDLYYPYDKDYDDVKFDTYKVFVNEAYSYE